jgi:hypothetical protein
MLENNKLKQLGIWLDHSRALIIENRDNIVATAIESNYDHITNSDSHYTSESHIHQKQKNILDDYYTKLSEVIINYSDVILFGPTDAKLELSNFLKKDSDFDHIHITTQASDKMTENEQIAYVKNFFKNSIFRNYKTISPRYSK